ncbi:hypothetical protein [Kitasatospora sp. NPDC089509]|uniref:hypothetical protein n=1 Tax=Kitasatospora sp. NPDC089509 TaxID=3364079 RepID=UPI0037FEEA1F
MAGSVRPLVAGLSGIVPLPVALTTLAAFPLTGLLLSLTGSPTADSAAPTRRRAWEPAMTVHLHLIR